MGKGPQAEDHPIDQTDRRTILRVWIAERGSPPAEPLFPTSTGKPLTRKALARRIAKHATHAAERCPSLTAKTITPHVYADPVVMPTLVRKLVHVGMLGSLMLA